MGYCCPVKVSKTGKSPDQVGGGKPGPGRPKGVPNKLTLTVRQVFERVFSELQDDPQAALAVWARDNPTDFYKIASKLIPADVNAKVEGTVQMIIATGVPTAGEDLVE